MNSIHLISNIAIALSYFAIPLALYQIRKEFSATPQVLTLLWLFIAFIMSCGIGHLFDAWQLPYLEMLWCAGVTAPISVISAVVLWRNLLGLREVVRTLSQYQLIWTNTLAALALFQPVIRNGLFDLQILQANPRAQAIARSFDILGDFEPGETLCEIMPGHREAIPIGDRRIPLIYYYQRVLQEGEPQTVELQFGDRWFENRSVPHYGLLLMSWEEITAQRMYEDVLKQTAETDDLTKIFNQHFFRNRVEKGDRYHGLLFIDMTGFKAVNDSKGHQVGDAVLVEVAKRLKALPIDADIIRYGGDEFLIGPRRSLNLLAIAKRALREINKPYHIGDHELYCTAAIGIAPATIQSLEDQFDAADIAMYRAKELDTKRQGHIQIWNGEIAKAFVRQRSIEYELSRGTKEEFWLAYQPIVRLRDRRIVGLEALARWQCASLGGFVSPAEFIPVAETTGQTFEIFKWAAKGAVLQLREWRDRDLVDDEFWISINCAPGDIVREEFTPYLVNLLDKYQLSHSQLGIEVTERGVAENVFRFTEVLEQLSSMRFSLKRDDFGGDSDQAFRDIIYGWFDTLKVDKGLQVTLDIGEALRRRYLGVLEAIAVLGDRLDLELIAEGVETEEQLEIISRLNFDYGQGFVFYRPMPAEEIEALLR